MPNRSFLFTIADIENVEEKYKSYCKNRIFVGPKKWCFPKKYLQFKDVYYNFEVRPNDIWITGFPRSGTTMTEELIWQIANNLDFEKAKTEIIEDRVPYFEWGMTSVDNTSNGNGKQVQQLADSMLKRLKLESKRRLIKSHLPFSLLPSNLLTSGCKVIYVARNPKDVITSLYNFFDLMKLDGYKLSFEEHFELFRRGHLVYCPYFEHLKQAWELRNEKNFLFVFYEDILKDKADTIKTIGEFLGRDLSNKEIENLARHLDIKNFKKRKTLNNTRLKELGLTNRNRNHDFIRKGVIGDWKNYATVELDQKANRWIEENLKGTGLTFTYQ